MSKHITMERTFRAGIDEAWDLWTTREGIESWWGPEGFETQVLRLDLRVGGTLEYTFTARGADQVAFLERANMPLQQRLTARYTAIDSKRLVAWHNLADFIPGIDPYEVETRVEFFKLSDDRLRLLLRFDVMHDEHFTTLATRGWESELGKLEALLAARRAQA